MLTARATEVDKVLGLEIGADDYVTKPFSPREVVARVKALLRRAYGSDAGRPHEVWERGRLRIDFDGYEAFLDGKPLHLSLREFELLRFFVQQSRASVLSRGRFSTSSGGPIPMSSRERWTCTCDVYGCRSSATTRIQS